jgi:hypothetical protein
MSSSSTPSGTVSSTDALDISRQCEKISFAVSKKNPNKFYVRIKDGPMGNTPIAMTNFCSMPVNGKKDANIRGISVIDGTYGQFAKLKLKLDSESAPDVLTLCKEVLSAWRTAYPPMSRSMWYQQQFLLEDGTKVFKATAGIEDPTQFQYYVFGGEDTYHAPSSTFAGALYGKDDDPWYVNVNVHTKIEREGEPETNPLVILCDENMKRIKTKKVDGKTIYESNGLSVFDFPSIKTLMESSFYKESQWACKTALQLSGLEWKTTEDTVSGNMVIYPLFHFKTVGSMVIKKSPYEVPEGVVPLEQRESILDVKLFAGMDAPSKKRKRLTVQIPKKKPVARKIEFEQEVIEDSDLEGEAEE